MLCFKQRDRERERERKRGEERHLLIGGFKKKGIRGKGKERIFNKDRER